jgi:iron complex outermembrane receptor protein
VFAAQGAYLSNGSDGTATVDLRGLGEARTLVLVNGRRLGPGDPNSATFAADVNQIPAALVRRIELLTGGASSVYGADALGGVVNFILDTRFDGLSLQAHYDFYDHHNDNPVAAVVDGAGFALPDRSVSAGYTKDFALVMGSGFADERAHATFYATYRNIDAVEQGDFDYSSCALLSGSTVDPTFTCGGSGTSDPARFRVRDPRAGPSFNRAISYTLDPETGQTVRGAPDPYNVAPLNSYQRPDERYTAGLFMEFESSARWDAYGELMFATDRSVAQSAPSGVFTREYVLSCANPLWTAAQEQSFCGQFGLDVGDASQDTIRMIVNRRNVEGGGRRDENEHTSYRAVLGMRGQVDERWSYDVYAQYATTRLDNRLDADFSIVRTGRALDVVADANGNAVCRAALDGTDSDCVPYDIWRLNGVTRQQLDYLEIPLTSGGEIVERVMNASITVDLGAHGFKLPAAVAGAVVNAGVEWREESSAFVPDARYQSGDGAGQDGVTLPLSGRLRAAETFVEARVPLVEARPGFRRLVAEAGFRYSGFGDEWTTDAHKLGLEWSPNESIRLRASFQRAVRVPNPSELFTIQETALRGTIDPCATPFDQLGNAPALSPEQCANTGVGPRDDANQTGYGWIEANPASRYQAFVGGNPQLGPERADSVSFGVALQPRALPGFGLLIDYYDIDIDDAIQSPNADFTLLACAITGDADRCSQVRRDDDGSLWLSDDGFVVDVKQNIGGIRTRGFDVDVSYAVELATMGRLRLGFIGTLLDAYRVTPQPHVSYDCKGLYGTICSSGEPNAAPLAAWRHALTATWRVPWLDASVTAGWRYIGEVKRDAESPNEFLAYLGSTTGMLPTDSHLGSRSFIDVSFAATLARRYTLRLGASNLFDVDPPLTGGTTCPVGPCNGNTWPQAYDALGRRIFANLSIDF